MNGRVQHHTLPTNPQNQPVGDATEVEHRIRFGWIVLRVAELRGARRREEQLRPRHRQRSAVGVIRLFFDGVNTVEAWDCHSSSGETVSPQRQIPPPLTGLKW